MVEVKRVGTGIEKLDDILGGGLFIGKKTLIYGATGVGKTILGVSVANNAKKDFSHGGVIFDVSESGDDQLQVDYAKSMFGRDIAEGDVSKAELNYQDNYQEKWGYELNQQAHILRARGSRILINAAHNVAQREAERSRKGYNREECAWNYTFLKQHFSQAKVIIIDGSNPFYSDKQKGDKTLAQEIMDFFKKPRYHVTFFGEPLWKDNISLDDITHLFSTGENPKNVRYGYMNDLSLNDVWIYKFEKILPASFREQFSKGIGEEDPPTFYYGYYGGFNGEYCGVKPGLLTLKEEKKTYKFDKPALLEMENPGEKFRWNSEKEEEFVKEQIKTLIDQLGVDGFVEQCINTTKYVRLLHDKILQEERVFLDGTALVTFDNQYLVPNGALPVNTKEQYFSDKDFAAVLMQTTDKRTIFDLVNRPIQEGAIDAEINTIICMGYYPVDAQNPKQRRALAVIKHRGSNYDGSVFEYEITDKGINIY